MKIIKRGQLPEERKHRTMCNNCQTQFEFTEAEATIGSDRNESFFIISCPLCHQKVYKDLSTSRYSGNIMEDH